jgi:hypothetical protein
MRSLLPLFLLALASAVPAVASEDIRVPAFRNVELRGGGSVIVVPGATQRVTILDGSSRYTHIYVERDGKLRIDTCNERCPRAYRLKVQIQSPTVPGLGIAGGGAIAAQPGFRSQPELSVAVNGGGRIDARSVEAQTVSAAVNGGGQILVRPGSSLSAAVNGGGLVEYSGNPAVTTAVHGGGAVRRGS